MLDFTTDYVDVETATEYHSARGNSAWAAVSSDEQKTQAIRRGTDYIAGRYNGRWIEDDDWDEDDVPDEVVYAICEAALRELDVPGSLTPDLKRGGDIKSVQAGSVGVTYMDSASAQTVFTKIDGLLSDLVFSSGVTRLVRA